MLILNQYVGFWGGGAFPVAAVNFNNSPYLNRGAQFTGAADSKQASGSCWVNMQGGNGSNQGIIGNDDAAATGFSFIRNSSNQFAFSFRNSAGSAIQAFRTSNTYTTSSGWLNVLWSFDAATGAQHLYVNDVSDLVSVTNTNDTVDFTNGDVDVGARGSGSTRLNAYMAEHWFAMGQYIDFSNAGNRAKFISAGKPVDPGSTGSAPTGTAPTMYLSARAGDAASVFASNRGTGGGMTTNGTLNLAPSAP